MHILTINPGSTSTKIGLFHDLEQVLTKTIRHTAEELQEFDEITDQYEFRKNFIMKTLQEKQVDISVIDAVVGRGGMLKPIPGGVYRVNQAMIEDLKKGILGEHASNLGGIIAKEMAREIKNRENAFIVDPVVVDEMDEMARISGRPELPRMSIFHALNQKAVARRYARENSLNYDRLNLIVVHLGGGITVGVHQNGRVIDVNNGLDGDGPFSPERAGSVPVGSLARLCFSGKYQLHQVKKLIAGKGGMVAYLETNDANKVELKINEGDKHARLIYGSMAYQISKEIGASAAVLKGNIDAILITGGLAKSEMLMEWIKDRIGFLAPVHLYPGEDELQALAENVYFALKEELPIKEYI